jgi:hypothetical protein
MRGVSRNSAIGQLRRTNEVNVDINRNRMILTPRSLRIRCIKTRPMTSARQIGRPRRKHLTAQVVQLTHSRKF